METHLFRSMASLEEAEPTWKELCTPEGLATHPFWTAEWLTLWWSHFGSEDGMWWVVARDSGRPVAIAPLQRRGRVVSCFGEGVSDYTGFLLPENSSGALGAVWDALRRSESQALRVVLDPLPVGSPTLDGLCGLLDGAGWPYWAWTTYEAPAVRWPEGWEAYWAGRKAKLKANLRRRRRNLESRGKVAVVHCLDEEELEAFWPHAQRLHRARWHRRYTRSLFTHLVGERFYRELARAFLRRGWLDLTFLCLDDRPIAFHFGFRYKGRYYYYIPAFDPAYSAYAPSVQLLVYLMQRAWETGCETFDFLIGDEPYKADWATEVQQTSKLVVPLREGWGRAAAALAVRRERWAQQMRRSSAVRRVVKPLLGWGQALKR